MMTRIAMAVTVSLGALLVGCEDKPATPPSTGASESAKSPAKPSAGKPEATPTPPAGGHHGAVVELGNATIGAFNVRASRDQGEIKAGGDAPIDVWLTGTDKVVAVRFWIGTGDAGGSVKAKADIEDPQEPNHWHTHAEVPNPLPSGSKLWVEIESEGGRKTTGSYDLKN